MSKLQGKRVVLTGARKADAIGAIVEKLGGVLLVRPTQGTVAVESEKVEAEIAKLLERGTDWVILTTGVGAEILYQAAENMGAANDFVEELRRTRIAARGYKTVKYLKTLGLEPTIRADDGTTAGILRALEDYDLRGQRVALQLYGDHAPRLVQWLKDKQANVHEILPYRNILPNLSVVDTLLSEIEHGEVDAVMFTSTLQVRFLMEYAREKGLADRVVQAFKEIVAVAVGKVTAEALKEEGIQRVIAPEEERMGSMVVALAKYFEEQRIVAND